MAATKTKTTKTATKTKTKAKTPKAGGTALKFGSPEWQAKYGRGKKKAK